VAGPLWIGNLFKDQQLTEAIHILGKEDSQIYHRRVPEILDKMLDESVLTDRPYIDIHALCDLHNQVPPKNQVIIDRLREQGFEVSRTHFKPTAIRTTASVDEITRIIADYNTR
jgi:tRNA (guanine26-N2/guanine27-N2)-dimethyltransferase